LPNGFIFVKPFYLIVLSIPMFCGFSGWLSKKQVSRGFGEMERFGR